MQQQNIDNLISLWLLVAEPFKAYKKTGNFNVIALDFSAWPVGCVATFIKDNQIGIHSLGILNQFRKQGLAEIVMHYLLGEAKNNGLENAHLQSSLLGLGIYRKIGFREIFKMCNFINNPNHHL